MSQAERVIVPPPPIGRNDPKDATCFALMHPLHGEGFTRYFSDLSNFRGLRDLHFTRTYLALEVATLDRATNQWIVSPEDTWYGGLWRREKRFLPPDEKQL
jgi:hypothetical protein